MKTSRPEVYHLPRIPMLMLAFKCANYMIVGVIVVILVPWHPWNLSGLGPILWGYLLWRYRLHPKMAYIVQLDASNLRFKTKEYPWNGLIALKVERQQNKRQLHLTYLEGSKTYDISIEDSVINFDILVQHCFSRYMAQQGLQAKTIDTAKTVKSSKNT